DSKKSTKAEETPRLKEVYLSKDEFDPGQHETTFIVFTLTEKADVKVTAYQGEDKLETFWEMDDRSAGTYAIEWEADDAEDEPGKYSIKVEAENSEGEDSVEVEVKIKEDSKDEKKPNILEDKVDQLPYNPKFNKLAITFNMDRDADVTVEIRDDSKVVATVIDEVSMVEGAHTVYWDGLDKYGTVADDGVYTYKIIAANVKGKDVEKGNFSVVDSSKAKNLYDRCGGFEDVTEDYKYCEAIQWAYDNEIFQGYFDGSFRPNQAISRSEVLKVIFKAREIGILSYNGETFGFTDLMYDWYSPYIKTALSLGVINGYDDGTFRPHQSVNRAEALAMLLRTGQAKDGIIIPTNNYGQPYYDVPTGAGVWYLSYVWFAQIYNLSDNEYYFFPAQPMTRAEMADMLYRYQKNV
ncbi:S-layer homology domain-containing protein, partial [Candidatus Peregrinibacteria bacterium]|nr:S-layer homology domain-containing protein [Candidatus Peregrinibacteria bacterium]